jgi:hypothetical protein
MIKKGQVSMFIVVGLFILIILGLLIYINDDAKGNVANDNSVGYNNDVVMVKSYIQNCLDRSVIEALDLISIQGGYYAVPESSYEINSMISVPYYYDFEKGDLVPTQELIKLNLEYAISDFVSICVGDFNFFEEKGIKIDHFKSPKTNVKFSDEVIFITFNYPLNITTENYVFTIDELFTDVKFPLLKLFNAAEKSIPIISENLKVIPTSKMIQFAFDNDVYIYVNDNFDGTVFYSFIANFNTSNEIFFNFATRNTIFNNSFNKKEVKIENNEILEAEVGYSFEYQLIVMGEGVTFKDYSSLFDITSDGLIKFEPKIENKGKHFILVEAKDNLGNGDRTYLELNIIYDHFPEIEPILNQEIKLGENFNYDVIAKDLDNDTIYYMIEGIDESSIDLITGKINYLAEKIGEYDINITVVDVRGNHVKESFVLEVEE